MPINFPESPSNNDVHTEGNRSWVYGVANGTWTLQSSALLGANTVTATELATNAVTSTKILDGTIATADIADFAITSAKTANLTVDTKTENYTLVAGDRGKRIVANSASAISFTVNNSIFSAGDVVEIHNINTGLLTVSSGTATINGADVLTVAQWQGGTLYFTSASSAIWFPTAKTVSVPPSGLNFVTGAAFTTATSFSLPNDTFDATYRNYRLVVQVSAVTADATFSLRARRAGSDLTGGIYDHAFVGITNTGSASNQTGSGVTSLPVGESDNSVLGYALWFDIIAPDINNFRTQFLGQYISVNQAATAVFARNGGCWLNDTGQIDSVSFISSVASSITGTYRVYGYSDS